MSRSATEVLSSALTESGIRRQERHIRTHEDDVAVTVGRSEDGQIVIQKVTGDAWNFSQIIDLSDAEAVHVGSLLIALGSGQDHLHRDDHRPPIAPEADGPAAGEIVEHREQPVDPPAHRRVGNAPHSRVEVRADRPDALSDLLVALGEPLKQALRQLGQGIDRALHIGRRHWSVVHLALSIGPQPTDGRRGGEGRP